jgi:UDP-2,3-diacylglucosamine hydrolase
MAPGKHVYFVSDVHLGVPDHASSLARERRLVAWLDHVAPNAEAIHVVGDLFDFWFEWRRAVPRGFVRVLGKLAELKDAGIDVQAYAGNHDLWYFGYFEEELGIPVHHAPMRWTWGGRDFVVGHGDGIGPGDHGYKAIKAVFRNRLCQWAFARLHPNLAVSMALFWSRKSRQADEGVDESFQGEAERQVIWARERQALEPADFYVFGHRHCPARYPLDERALFVNLGDWITHFSFAEFDGEALHLRHWDGARVRPMEGVDVAPGFRGAPTPAHG